MTKKKTVVEISLANAWKGFKGWWIPLCMLSFVLLMTQSWIPTKLMSNFPELEVFVPVKNSFVELFDETVQKGGVVDQNEVTEFFMYLIDYFEDPAVVAQVHSLFMKIVILLVIITFIVVVVHISLLVASRAALAKKELRGEFCKKKMRKIRIGKAMSTNPVIKAIRR